MFSISALLNLGRTFFGPKLASLDTSALVVETVWAGRRGQTCFVSFVSPTRPTSLQGMLEGMEMWIVGRRSRWGIGKTYPRVRLSGTRHATPLNDRIQSIRSNPMDSIEWILLTGASRLTQGHQIYIKANLRTNRSKLEDEPKQT